MRIKTRHTIICLLSALLLSFVACAGGQNMPEPPAGNPPELPPGQEMMPGEMPPGGMQPPGPGMMPGTDGAITEPELFDSDGLFSDRDWETEYDADAVRILLDNGRVTCTGEGVTCDGGNVTITKAGTYALSGSLENGSIVVDADKEDKVQLVLEGVSLTAKAKPLIWVKQADKVFLTLAEASDNNLTVTGSFDEQAEADAAIYSKDDLTINGSGALTIQTESGDGIVSKDDLVVTGGNYRIETAGDAMSGKDSVRIADGNFSIVAGESGIHSENDEDSTLGYVYLQKGKYDITAGNDGIHAGTHLVQEGGDITIHQCEEGLEGMYVDIRGGSVTLASADDGINASMPDAYTDVQETDCYIRIAGGVVKVTTSGDGLDSNGFLLIEGGETYVSGPEQSDNGSIDYDVAARIRGGIVVAAGCSGMMQGFGNASTQASLLVNLPETAPVGTRLELKDKAGTTLLQYVPEAEYSCVVISIPELEVGQTYILSAGTQSSEVTVNGMSFSGGMFGGRPGGMPEGGPGERQEDIPGGVPPAAK